jgi:hypothetical protein
MIVGLCAISVAFADIDSRVVNSGDNQRNVEKIITELDLDLDVKSLRGWRRFFNYKKYTNTSNKEYTEQEIKQVLAYIEVKKHSVDSLYKRGVN